jgi:FixJ family two-component response regulator
MVGDVRLPDEAGLDLVEGAVVTDPPPAVVVIGGLDDVALADHAHSRTAGAR